jgi:hypothetical protein
VQILYVVLCQIANVNGKGGHPQFANIADYQMIAELRIQKSCGTAIADLQNLTSAILQLSAVSGHFPYLLVPFSQRRMLKKSTKNNFYNRLFNRNQKLVLKGQ